MKKLSVALVLVFTLLPLSKASAHVFILDTTQATGAVLHINPDDDPIAGEKSQFFFDSQALSGANEASFSITIDGTVDDVEMEVNDTLATAEYVFASQGVYKLEFTVSSGGDTYVFEHTQRVSRGVSDSPLDEPVHAWAEVALVTGIAGLALLAIIVFNRRLAIGRQSKF